MLWGCIRRGKENTTINAALWSLFEWIVRGGFFGYGVVACRTGSDGYCTSP